MEILEFIKAIAFGIIQGITEWLPISSTGHMILADEFIKLNFSDLFVSTFLVVIQFGSILAVLFLFFKKLNPFDTTKTKRERRETVDLWFKVIVAVIPSGIIGVLFDDKIDAMFYNATTVSLTLIIYGILFIVIENRNKRPTTTNIPELTYKTAILIPGTSRSGATIIGATILGCSRFVAAEFSFFLAIPTMLGASALKLVKAGFAFSGLEWAILLTGSVVAFLVSVFAIKFHKL